MVWISPSALRLLFAVAGLWLLNLAVLGFSLGLLQIDWSRPHGMQWAAILLVQIFSALAMLWLSRKALRWKKRRSTRLSPEVKEERARIAQDLHDGVGAHLFQALALLEEPRMEPSDIRRSIENAMWCLRVEMGALDNADASLIERLASLRGSLQPLLNARGVEMAWQMPEQEDDRSPEGRQGQHLAMLTQEAISNALRHSQCKVLQVKLACAGPQWQLLIADDGCGYESHLTTDTKLLYVDKGRGMRSMQQRAQQANAVMKIEGLAGRGTRIYVSWQAVPSVRQERPCR